MRTDSPTLLQPLLYYDTGFGFSEKDTLTAPDCTTDELTGAVTATFELPVAAQKLRFDPGELPCCVTQLLFSDDRIVWEPANGTNLQGNTTLFLGDDPNYRLEGLSQYPAGMKLVVSYCYYPLESWRTSPSSAPCWKASSSCRRIRTAKSSTSPSWNRLWPPSSRP